MKEDFALIIGINDYTLPGDNGLATLKGAINDANKFEEWVINPQGGNVPASNSYKVISQPEPNLSPIQDQIDDKFLSIEKSLKNLIASGNSARRLYFYFAGHGLGTLDSVTDTALVLANWSELRRHSAISSEGYKDVIRQYGYFEEIIFIVDCCRNIKINVKPKHPSFSPPIPSPNSGATKLFVGYATHYQDQSFEIETGNSEMRGVFTKVFLDGLNGGAINSEGIIDADSLRNYLIKETPTEAIKKGYKQIPEIINTFTNNTPFILTSNLINKDIKCIIKFDTNRNSIELINGNAESVRTFDAREQKTFEILLSKGLFLLRDTLTEETKVINISTLNEEIYVNF